MASPTSAPGRSPSTPAGPRRVRRKAAADTQARILDAAESLFIEMGFAATSLRAIAKRADVNLAAAHYHFGSKEGLLGAVVHRRVGPVNDQRTRSLDALRRETAIPSVRQVLQAFFQPLAEYGPHGSVPRLMMARLYGEPESVSQPLIEREF